MVLMRKQDGYRWLAPIDFNMLTPQAFSEIVTDALLHLPSNSRIMINLDHDQFVDHAMLML